MPLHPAIKRWYSDPEFTSLPENDQRGKLSSFFEKELADDDFYKLPEKERAAKIDNFVVQHVHLPTSQGFDEEPGAMQGMEPTEAPDLIPQEQQQPGTSAAVLEEPPVDEFQKQADLIQPQIQPEIEPVDTFSSMADKYLNDAQDRYAGKKPDEAGFFQEAGAAFKEGLQGVELDIQGFDIAVKEAAGVDVAEEKAAWMSARQQMKEQAGLAAEADKDKGWLEKAALGAVRMAGPMIEGSVEGLIAGGIAAAAGQAGPQVFTPEEIITVPLAIAVGAGQYWYRQGFGQTYGELMDKGVDPGIAKKVATVVAPIYAYVEFSQVGKIVPGLDRIAQRKATDAVTRIVMRAAGKYGLDVATEVGEEVVQEATMIAGEEVGKAINDAVEGTELESTPVREVWARLWDTLKASASPMALLLLPKRVGGTVQDVTARKQLEDDVDKLTFEQRMAIGLTDEVLKSDYGIDMKGKPTAGEKKKQEEFLGYKKKEPFTKDLGPEVEADLKKEEEAKAPAGDEALMSDEEIAEAAAGAEEEVEPLTDEELAAETNESMSDRVGKGKGFKKAARKARREAQERLADITPEEEAELTRIANESVNDIVKRTDAKNNREAYEAAMTARGEASKKLVLSLRKGDVITSPELDEPIIIFNLETDRHGQLSTDAQIDMGGKTALGKPYSYVAEGLQGYLVTPGAKIHRAGSPEAEAAVAERDAQLEEVEEALPDPAPPAAPPPTEITRAGMDTPVSDEDIDNIFDVALEQESSPKTEEPPLVEEGEAPAVPAGRALTATEASTLKMLYEDLEESRGGVEEAVENREYEIFEQERNRGGDQKDIDALAEVLKTKQEDARAIIDQINEVENIPLGLTDEAVDQATEAEKPKLKDVKKSIKSGLSDLRDAGSILNDMFGTSENLSFSAMRSQEELDRAYAAVRVKLESSWDHFKDAGHQMLEWMRHVIRELRSLGVPDNVIQSVTTRFAKEHKNEKPTVTGEEGAPADTEPGVTEGAGLGVGRAPEGGRRDEEQPAGVEGEKLGGRQPDEDLPETEPPVGDVGGEPGIPGGPAGVEGQPPAGSTGEDLPGDTGIGVVSETPGGDVESERPSLAADNYNLNDKEQINLTKGQRREANAQAKAIIERDSEPADLTEEERNILRQYTGQGGLRKTGDDYGLENLNQHYTDYQTIRAVYAALEHAGYHSKRALEPAVGSGNFVGHKPGLMWTTVDIDKTNHEVVKLLYPQAEHYNTSFEFFIESGFDLIISNVPFLEQRGAGKNYARSDIKTLHDFYFVHALDLVKDNGIVAFVTSAGTMDKGQQSVRDEIVSKADVIAAFRLPSGHFESVTHTKVMTDIIILQKRPIGVMPLDSRVADNQAFVVSEEREGGPRMSRYYENHPGRLLGDLVLGKNELYGGKPQWVVEGDADLSLIRLPAYHQYESLSTDETEALYQSEASIKKSDFRDKYLPALEKKYGSNFITIENNPLEPNADYNSNAHLREKGGEPYLYTLHAEFNYSDVLGSVKVYLPTENEQTNKLKDLYSIQDATDSFQRTQNSVYADEGVELIGRYKEAYGKHPSKDKELKAAFPLAEEGFDSLLAKYGALFDTEFEPADVLKMQTKYIGSGKVDVGPDSPLAIRALASEDNKGMITISKSNFIIVDDVPELIKTGYSVIGWDGEDAMLQNDILYYSGMIYDKVDAASDLRETIIELQGPTNEIAEKLKRQVDKLEEIKPEARSFREIELTLTEGWAWDYIDGVVEFSKEVNEKGNYEYVFWRNKPYQNFLNGHRLVNRQKYENAFTETVAHYMVRYREAEREVQEIHETQLALIEQAGVDTDLELAFNRRFSGYVKPNYERARYLVQDVLDEIAVNLKDNPKVKGLRKNQVEWLVQAVYEGKGINAHDVGGGKTFAAIALARAMKMRGSAQKPLFVVPAKTLRQWERSINLLFPDAKVFNLLNLPKDRRRELLHQIANTNADYVLISHEGFKQLKLPRDIEIGYVERLMNENVDVPEDAKDTREAALAKQHAEDYIDALRAEQRDPNLTFDALGFDMIVADEAHNYKNIGVRGSLARFKVGVPFGFKPPTATRTHPALKSARSYDFRFKVDFVSENNNGRNVFLLTATPTPNKPMELYTMIRHLDHDILNEYGIRQDVDFKDNFFVTGMVENRLTNKNEDILTHIKNVPELRSLIERYIDKRSIFDMPWIEIPGVEDVEHYLERNDGYELVMEDIEARRAELPSPYDRKPGDDTLISLYTGERAAAIDPRLYGGPHAGVEISFRSFDNQDDKIEFTIDKVARVLKEAPWKRVIIFLDKAGHIQAERGILDENLHRELKRMILDRTGLTANEVGIVSGKEITNPFTGREVGSVNKYKQHITDLFNGEHPIDQEGEQIKMKGGVEHPGVRLLIGTTSSLGEGMDLQHYTTDIIHMDIPWTPGAIWQRNGRAVRYGNENYKVRIHYLFMEGTFDRASHQIIAHKRGWNAAIWDKEAESVISVQEEMIGGVVPSAQQIQINLERDPIARRILILGFQYDALTEQLMQLNQDTATYEFGRLPRFERNLENARYELEERRQRLTDLKPDMNISNEKIRKEKYEKSKRYLEETLIPATEKRIEKIEQSVVNTRAVLDDMKVNQVALEEELRQFEEKNFNEQDEIYVSAEDAAQIREEDIPRELRLEEPEDLEDYRRKQEAQDEDTESGLDELAQEEVTAEVEEAPAEAEEEDVIADEALPEDPEAEINKADTSPPAKPKTAKEKMKRKFGETIGGSRWDESNAYRLEVEDLKDMDEREIEKFVTKKSVWPTPNWEELVRDKGMPVNMAWVVKQIKDKIDTKPIGIDAEQYVRIVGVIRDKLMAARTEQEMKDNLDTTAAFYETQKVFHKGRHDQYWNTTNEYMYVADHDLQRAKRDTKSTGWPFDQGVWRKGIEIHERTKWDYEKKEETGNYYIIVKSHGDRGYYEISDTMFATHEDAERYLLTILKPELEEQASQKGKKRRNLRRPILDQVKRSGKNWRQNKDVTEDDVLNTFGFRGGELGEWVRSKPAEAQEFINHGYDALMDLADVLGIPPAAIGLNGELGIAFGARGRGGRAAAHYEPVKVVFNLTKTKGAGALAHEWGHGLDDFFARMVGYGGLDDYMSYLAGEGKKFEQPIRPELKAAWVDLMKTMYKTEVDPKKAAREQREKVDKYTRQLKSTLTSMREILEKRGVSESTLRQFDVLAQEVMDGKHREDYQGKAWANSKLTVPEIDTFLKATGQKLFTGHQDWMRHNAGVYVMWLRTAKNALKDLATDTPRQKFVKSEFLKSSQNIDKGRAKYWSLNHELFARALESYVEDKVRTGGNVSEYLVQGTRLVNHYGKDFPYPVHKERTAINKAFDKFFAELRTHSYVKQFETSGEREVGLLFSTADEKAVAHPLGRKGSTVMQVERWTRALRAEYVTPIYIVQSVDDVPEQYQVQLKLLEKQRKIVRGFLDPDTNEVYLIANGIGSAEEAVRVVLHESAGHYGLRTIVGEEWYKFMEWMIRSPLYGTEIWKVAEEQGKTLHEAAEEWFAIEIERTDGKLDATLWQRFLYHIRKWLMEKGMNIRFSDNDLRALMMQANKAAKKYPPMASKEVSYGNKSNILYGTDSPQGEWYSQMEYVIGEKLPESGNAQNYRKLIEGWADKGEYKKEELSWSGLLDDESSPLQQKGKITKQQVVDWLAANNVRVEEVQKVEDVDDGRRELQIQLLPDEQKELISLNLNDRTDSEGRKVLFIEEAQGLPLLAFKKSLRISAEEGYDAIGWTAGTQQPEINEYVKKWNGHTAASLLVDEVDPVSINVLPITPSMRQTALMGQPLFSSYDNIPALRQQLRDVQRTLDETPEYRNGESTLNFRMRLLMKLDELETRLRSNGSVQMSTVPTYGFYQDNPGGDWLAEQRAYAADKIKNTANGKEFGTGAGALTAGYQAPLFLPVDMLKGLPGARGEHDRLDSLIDSDGKLVSAAESRYDRQTIKALRDSMLENGFDEKQSIIIWVEYNGDASIAEGNHRLRAALAAGLESVPVEIRYYAGGELEDGLLHPSLVEAAASNLSQGTGKLLLSTVPADNQPSAIGGRHELVDPSVQERIDRADGVKIASWRERAAITATDLANKVRREYEYLPKNEEFAQLRFDLLRLTKQKGVQSDYTIRQIAQIVDGLDADDYYNFKLKVMFDDFAAMLEEDETFELPFGLNKEIFDVEYSALNEAIEGNENIALAMERRRQVWNTLKADYTGWMEQIGFNVEKRLTKKNYYRHQVLEFAQVRGLLGIGQKLKTPTGRSFLKYRAGSGYDINSNYIEAEHEVMAQMNYDIQVAKTVYGVDVHYNLVDALKMEAAELNESGIMEQFREMAAADEDVMSGEIDEAAQALYRAILHRKQAMAMTKLGKLAVAGELPGGPGGKFDGLTEALANNYLENEALEEQYEDDYTPDMRRPFEPQFQSMLLPYLQYLTTAHRGTEYGIAGATFFKGVMEKREYMKENLAGDYVTWKDLVPEGYTTWQPREGNVFYLTDTISANLANRLLEDAVESIEVKREMLRKALSMGGKRKEFVVKNEVAATLDEIIHPANQGLMVRFEKALIQSWKQWQLLSPRRFSKYNIRNLTGDADAAFAGNPRVFRFLPQAVRDLWKAYRTDEPLTGDVKDWFDRGGQISTLQAQEMGDLNKLSSFLDKQGKQQQKVSLGAKLTSWKDYWRAVRISTDFREALLRYAAYLEALDQMKRYEGRILNYGASKKTEIEGLEDPKDKAYWIANDLLGAYDRVGVMGQHMRESWIPFWSWKEVNMKRYIQLFRNAAEDNTLAEAVGRKLVGTTVRGTMRVIQVGKFWLKATALMAMVQVFNRLVFPDDDDDLPQSVRDKPHITLGRDSDGNIRYFSRIGALGDLLEWVNLDAAPRYVNLIMDGKMSPTEAAKEMFLKQPVNVLVQGMRPFVKLAGEVITRRSLFPDLWRPGTVRDRGLHVARSFGLEKEYSALTGKPQQFQYLSTDNLETFVWYKIDPAGASYWRIQDEQRRFLQSKGKTYTGFHLTPTGNTLYNMKMALRYGDYDTARDYLDAYHALGGTNKGLRQSLKSLQPLNGISKGLRTEFVEDYLDDEGRSDLARATKYYQELYDAAFKELPGTAREPRTGGGNVVPKLPAPPKFPKIPGISLSGESRKPTSITDYARLSG